jgi:SAM-dependent methyltransferase
MPMSAIGNQAVPAPPGVSPEDTVAAYERLADEYDSPEHRTTRALERLSADALGDSGLLRRDELTGCTILELGAGTGALTAQLLAGPRLGSIIVTEPSRAMLDRARERANGHADVEFCQEPAVAALLRHGRGADVVVGALADPFLTEDLLHVAFAELRRGAWLFVTVPSRRWAVSERAGRLMIPVDRTRFRTHDGEIVWSSSSARDEGELRGLLSATRFDVVASGTLAASAASDDAPDPEIAWVLARS